MKRWNKDISQNNVLLNDMKQYFISFLFQKGLISNNTFDDAFATFI